MDHHAVAAVSLTGICLDVLGGLYLAYDLLGGQHGPLRLLTRMVTYSIVFGIGYGIGLGFFLGVASGAATGITFAIELRRKLAVDQIDSDTHERHVWIADERGLFSRPVSNHVEDYAGLISSDGRVVFTAGNDLYLTSYNGGAPPEVLFSIRLLQPGETLQARFTAPTQPGNYPFICTFPAHWRTMNGIIEVRPPASQVSQP